MKKQRTLDNHVRVRSGLELTLESVLPLPDTAKGRCYKALWLILPVLKGECIKTEN